MLLDKNKNVTNYEYLKIIIKKEYLKISIKNIQQFGPSSGWWFWKFYEKDGLGLVVADGFRVLRERGRGCERVICFFNG